MAAPRIAIAFFGITRSLDHTLPSIERNVVGPARDAGAVTVYAHFFEQTAIDNPRSGEKAMLNPNDHKRLPIDHLQLEAPNACLALRDFEGFQAWGDPWADDFRSLRNLIHQLHSLACVSRRVLEDGADICLFVRPDLRYLDSFAPVLQAALRGTEPRVWTPDWQPFGGLNDRFSLCRGAEAIAAYGGRIAAAKPFCSAQDRPLHAEELVAFALKNAGIPVTPMPLRASRVRVDGSVPPQDQFPNLAKRMGKAAFEQLGLWKHLQRMRGRA